MSQVWLPGTVPALVAGDLPAGSDDNEFALVNLDGEESDAARVGHPGPGARIATGDRARQPRPRRAWQRGLVLGGDRAVVRRRRHGAARRRHRRARRARRRRLGDDHARRRPAGVRRVDRRVEPAAGRAGRCRRAADRAAGAGRERGQQLAVPHPRPRGAADERRARRARSGSMAVAAQLPAVLVGVVAGALAGLVGAQLAMPIVPLFATAPEVSTLDLGTAWGGVVLAATLGRCVVLGAGQRADRPGAGPALRAATTPGDAVTGTARALRVSTQRLVHIYRSEGHEVAALSGVDLDVAPGEMVGLLGPSGAGQVDAAEPAGRASSSPAPARCSSARSSCPQATPRQLDELRALEVSLMLQGASRNLLPYFTPARERPLRPGRRPRGRQGPARARTRCSAGSASWPRRTRPLARAQPRAPPARGARRRDGAATRPAARRRADQPARAQRARPGAGADGGRSTASSAPPSCSSPTTPTSRRSCRARSRSATAGSAERAAAARSTPWSRPTASCRCRCTCARTCCPARSCASTCRTTAATC